MATPAIRETGDATYGVSKLGRQAVGAPIRKCRVGRTAALLRFGCHARRDWPRGRRWPRRCFRRQPYCAASSLNCFTGADRAAIVEQLAVTEKACAAARRPRRSTSGGVRCASRAGVRRCRGVARAPDGVECSRCEDCARHRRDQARKKRLDHANPEDLHRRQRQAREFRHWRDDLGIVRLAGALPSEIGVPFTTRLDAECDRARRAAGKGTTCVEEGCGRKRGLEWDHVDPVANHGPTSYENLKPRCWPHHQEKTERDRKAGLLGNVRSGPRGDVPRFERREQGRWARRRGATDAGC
jgi:hypothetical protein